MSRFQRPQKFDRLTNPDASAVDTEIHYTLAPFDEAARAADLKWGVDRLPGLVSDEMAKRYGRAKAALDQAIAANDPEAVRQNAANCAKGLAAMDRAATEAGHPVASPEFWQFDVDGFRFAILRDARMWPAMQDQSPDVPFVTPQELANALQAYRSASALPTVVAIKDHFPNAKITKITPAKATDLDDEIPW